MTKNEFLDRLYAIETRWYLDDDFQIRCAAGDCPITKVAAAECRQTFDVSNWDDAAAAIDLDFDDAQEIVNAADLANDYLTELRADLLAVTVEKGKADATQ